MRGRRTKLPIDVLTAARAHSEDPFIVADMLANAYFAHIERQPDSVRKNLHLNDVMTRAYHALGGQEGLEPRLPAQPDIQTGGAYGPSLAYTIRTADKPKP